MAIVTTDDKHYKAIADVIRRGYVDDIKFRPEDMAGEIDLALNDKFLQGHMQGYGEGYDAGQQAEYDRFWDAILQDGNRDDYYYLFSGYGWTAETFKPKYDIRGWRFQGTFAYTAQLRVSLIDLLDACGVVLDTSKATSVYGMFQYSSITEIPHIDLSSLTTNASGLFSNCTKLKRIEKITYTEKSACYAIGSYQECRELEDVEFAGVIAGDMNLSWSPLLTDATVQSLIDHLKDLTGQAVKTLTLHATVGAKLTDAQKATITAKNWQLVY